MWWLYDVGINSLLKIISVLVCEWIVVSLHEVVIEGGVWAHGRTDCHNWEVQIRETMGCSGCPNRFFYPCRVRLINEVSCCYKTTDNDKTPEHLANLWPCRVYVINAMDCWRLQELPEDVHDASQVVLRDWLDNKTHNLSGVFNWVLFPPGSWHFCQYGIITHVYRCILP